MLIIFFNEIKYKGINKYIIQMAKAMLENPEVAAYFIQIVEEFGGIEKVSWMNVARKLYNAF